MANKLLLKLVTVVVALTMVALGCGNDDDASAPEPTSEPTSQETTAAPEAEPTEVEMPSEPVGDDDPPYHDVGSDFVAAFVYVGPVGDAGWTWAHDQGRQFAEDQTGATTLFVENVAENAEDLRAVAVDFIENEGADVIFATSFGYMDTMAELAEEYPEVVFEHASGFKRNDTNFGNYFGRMYQPRYLSGMAAGAMTETDKIGYVAAFPIPEVLRGINAFTLGAQRTNPDVEVHVNWTLTWFDPAIERDTALALLDAGADAIAMHQDTPASGIAAQEREARWVSYNSDMSSFAPEAFITAPVWDWGPYYTRIIAAVANGTYEPAAYWGGMEDEIVGLAPPADDVPEEVVNEMLEVAKQLEDGSWDVFTGEIKDQDGNVVVAEGETMDDGAMLGMEFFVEGVVGNPSS